MENDALTDEEFHALLTHYLYIGALELRIEDGEECYYLTPEAEALAPEFYQVWMEDLEESLMTLYNQDLISVDYDEQLEATYTLTDKGRAYVDGI